MAVVITTEPIKNVFGITSAFNSLNQLRYVFEIDVLQGNDAVVIEITDSAGVINLLGIDEQLFYIAPVDGSPIVVDVAQILLHIVKRDKIAYLRFTLKYAHISEAGTSAATISNQIIINFSRLPTHLNLGSNMALYLIKDRGLPPFPDVPPVLPLTEFIVGNVVWRGIKKTIDFITDSELATRIPADDVICTIEIIDGAGGVLGLLSTTPLLANDSITRVIVNISSALTTTNFPEAKWLRMQLAAVSLPNMPLSVEPYYFDIKSPCTPVVILSWVNDQGGVESWVFERDFGIITKADKGSEVDVPLIDDIGDQEKLIDRVSDNSFTQTLSLVADNVTRLQHRVLTSIKNSRLIWIPLDADDTDRIEVIATNNFTSERQARSSLSEFRLEVKLPKNVDILSLLLYN